MSLIRTLLRMFVIGMFLWAGTAMMSRPDLEEEEDDGDGKVGNVGKVDGGAGDDTDETFVPAKWLYDKLTARFPVSEMS